MSAVERVSPIEQHPLNIEQNTDNTMPEFPQTEASSESVLFKIILDVIFLTTPAIVALVLFFTVDPFERGFFCNDESLMHPFMDDTIGNLMVALLFGIFTIILVFCVETTRSFCKMDVWERSSLKLFSWRVPIYVQKLYQYIGIALFAMSINQFFTDISKYLVGRFRPHFIEYCQPIMPNGSTCEDSENLHRYIRQFRCSNPLATDRLLKEMRLSFPSAHSSFAFVTMVFCVLYVQKRITWRRSHLLKHILQVIFLFAATATALSRISDYKHHWSDVFAGFVIGTTIAIILCVYVSDLYKSKNKKPLPV